MTHLGHMTTARLKAWIALRGVRPAAADAVARALVGRFAARTPNGSDEARKPARALLLDVESQLAADLPTPHIVRDPDGTLRYALRLRDHRVVEAVAILHAKRTTVCLSSQVGCARACVFCETGRLGLARQLAVHEITGQLAAVARDLAARGESAPTNLVFMGMGEPLDNLESVLEAIEVMSDDHGFAIAQRRITISTVGVVPKLRELFARSKVRVAVSLHAANDVERAALLPIARTWDLASLRAALTESPGSVLLQWTLIAGVNDSERHARELIAFAQGLNVRVNVIPMNPCGDAALRSPPMPQVRAFQRRLADAGLRVMVRLPHGQSIGGACGQLAGAARTAG